MSGKDGKFATLKIEDFRSGGIPTGKSQKPPLAHGLQSERRLTKIKPVLL
jgi:hypothetical protein